ncbi:MAG: hypothetical protein M3313_14065 [Actinomycetota bacterium]|nr:hypothetical protein [Actinomycetota bacterium]
MLQDLSLAAEWRRHLRAISRGLTTYGAAASAHEHLALARALRCRQIRPRRIAVIGSNGGVGTTTAAVLLASVLAAARVDQTLLLTLHSDASDVAARLAVPRAPSVSQVLDSLRQTGRIPPTPVTRTGLRVLSAPPAGSPALETGLDALLDVAAAGHASVVVDAGVANRIGCLGSLAELFDTVVLACGTTSDAVAATATVLTRWSDRQPTPDASRLILAPVRSRHGQRRAGSDPVGRLSVDGLASHALPYDPELGRGRPIEMSALSGPSMTAMLRLGAEIMAGR